MYKAVDRRCNLVNAIFACNLAFAHKKVLEANIYLQRLTYPVLAMMHLQWFTCD